MSNDHIVVTDLLKLDTGSSGLLDLFEIQLDDTDWIYVTNYSDYTTGSPTAVASVQFRDYVNNSQVNTYVPIPCNLEGIEHKSDGPMPQPKFTISNILRPVAGEQNSFEGLLGTFTFKDLLGKKIIRRRTMEKYLYNKPSDQSPPVELTREIYYLDRIEDENPQSVTFNLVSPIDIENVSIPSRIVVGNACPWKYTGASITKNRWELQGGCSWPEDGSFDIGGFNTNVYVSIDDHYIVPQSALNPSLWIAGTKNKDEVYYTVNSTNINKIQPNGALSYDVIFDGTDANTSTEIITKANNFITGDSVKFIEGSAALGGVTDDTEYFLNVSGTSIKLYDTEVNAVTGGGTGLINITNQNGTGHTLRASAREYWQVKATSTTDTPSTSSNAWERVLLGISYTGSIPIRVFTEDLYNTIAVNASKMWKGITISQEPNSHIESPVLGDYWEAGDYCGKRLSSCAKRFGANLIIDLDYDNVVNAFTVGRIISGLKYGGSGRIVANDGSTLTLVDVDGDFENNETIKETTGGGSAGEALVNETSGWVNKGQPTRPSLDIYENQVLPFGAFPTARSFDGA